MLAVCSICINLHSKSFMLSPSAVYVENVLVDEVCRVVVYPRSSAARCVQVQRVGHATLTARDASLSTDAHSHSTTLPHAAAQFPQHAHIARDVAQPAV